MIRVKRNKILGIVFGVILVTAAIYGMINAISATDPDTSATIRTELPMLAASNIGMSLNGGLTITAPDNTPGHWEIKEHGYFTDNKEVEFCLIKTIGIEEFIFIPDNPNARASSVYSVVFAWKAHTQEIMIFTTFSVMIIFLYFAKKVHLSPIKIPKVT